MARFVLLVCFSVLCVRGVEGAPPAPIRVMSFNIRFGTAKDGPNHWDQRKEFVTDTIKAFDPDLVGTQETLGFQRDFLAEKLPGYTALGVGRDDGLSKGEMMAIYVRKDRFEITESGHFWLSETPDVIGSKSWDTSLPRMATWVELKDTKATGTPSLVWMNTHFDHIGVEARKQSARLLRERVQSQKDKPVIVTGDFNSIEGSEAYQNLFGPIESQPSLLMDTFRVLPKEQQRFDDVATFSGFKAGARKGGRIDWIGVTDHFKVVSSEIDYTERDGRTPSDHFPVTAVLEWKASANAVKK